MNPKVDAHIFQSFLEMSSSLISNIVGVGTTSDNVSSKKKILDEVSLSSSESETRHDHRSTSTSYLPMDPGIWP
ncbi:hypothetical protein HKD37_01G001547 [Glycine soja]